MTTLRDRKLLLTALAAAVIATVATRPSMAGVPITHLYELADFNGVLPLGEVRVHTDPVRDEVYVCDGDRVRIFNASGMETFWFGLDPRLGSIRDLAIDETGDLTLLAYEPGATDPPRWFLSRCNYRGEPAGKTAVSGLPPSLSAFAPNIILSREKDYLLVSRFQMLAALVDRSGAFVRAYDLAEIVGVPPEERGSTEIFGFSVDPGGAMRFTIPVLFKAFIVSPDGRVSSFGRGGSAPGMFGVASGIVADEAGNSYVADRLHGVVIVFDKESRFVGEFGFRGNKPGSLVRPNDLAMGASGKLYVTQASGRGVSVFSTAQLAPPTAPEGGVDVNGGAEGRRNAADPAHGAMNAQRRSQEESQ